MGEVIDGGPFLEDFEKKATTEPVVVQEVEKPVETDESDVEEVVEIKTKAKPKGK